MLVAAPRFVSGHLPHGHRNALFDTIGQRRRSLDWGGADIPRVGIGRGSLYGLDAPRTCAAK